MQGGDVKVSTACTDCPWELVTGSVEEAEMTWLDHRERWCPKGVAAVEAQRRKAKTPDVVERP
jgi:negative regulator of sigma E activity